MIRLNRDTLYSFGVFDLDAAPVKVTLPDAGKRYMAMQVIDEDQYAPGRRARTRSPGRRYAVRLPGRADFVNPNDAADVKAVHALQEHPRRAAGAGQVRDAGLGSGVAEEGPRGAAGPGGRQRRARLGTDVRQPDEVDPVQHLIGTAAGWGGNPRYAALYSGVDPKQNDGQTAYRLRVKDVPVDGFWSVSVYNQAGFFEKNSRNAYTVNNVTAKPNSDGSVTIHFGGDKSASNYLPIVPGWNYTVRMYRSVDRNSTTGPGAVCR